MDKITHGKEKVDNTSYLQKYLTIQKCCVDGYGTFDPRSGQDPITIFTDFLPVLRTIDYFVFPGNTLPWKSEKEGAKNRKKKKTAEKTQEKDSTDNQSESDQQEIKSKGNSKFWYVKIRNVIARSVSTNGGRRLL